MNSNVMSGDALALLRSLRRMREIYVPRLERHHLELLAKRFMGYSQHREGRGYWLFACPRGDEYVIELEKR
ncbi:MAG: hypothetical protein EB015_15350 [Methylocystaceae bacterium]|nr:hypothetical protein [Methylocystaceae bacterium]